ncbi:sugar O-acetyltransferase [Yimella sp. cx-573]|nr:sugar O-acetyltransferase [Yimella sp. cx-573]
MRERMESGELYIAIDPELRQMSSAALDLINEYNETSVRQANRRREILEQLLGAVGDDCEIRPPFQVDYGSNIRMGNGCFANFGLIALDVATITIGDDVLMGPNVQLLTPTHPIAPGPRRAKWEAAKPIVIEDNVWLGGGAIVCPGVTIGENSIVAAGAVVVKDVPANVIVGGNPAKVLREFSEAERAELPPVV